MCGKSGSRTSSNSKIAPVPLERLLEVADLERDVVDPDEPWHGLETTLRRSEDLAQLVGADVAAAQDERDALPGEPVAKLQRRRERGGSGKLGEIARALEQLERRLARASSSLTRTKSSSCSQSIRCGSSNATRVARPSARVAIVSSSRLRDSQERYAAGAASDWTPITSIDVADRLGGDAGAGGSAPAADRHDDDVDLRLLLEDLERVRPDAGDQQRLVAGVDVAVAVLGREPLAVLASLVEVLPVDDELGAERPASRPA